VLTLALSPDYDQDGVLFAGTAQDGIFRSADRGRRWVGWNFGLADLNVLNLALSPRFATDETLWVGTETGLFRSTNGGRAWREVPFPTEWAPVLSLAVSPDYDRDGMIFVGTDSCGLFRSRDQGETWERLDEGALPSPVNALAISPRFPLRPDLLALTGVALLLSRNGGCSWQDLTPGLTSEQGMTCALAPLGLDAGAPLLVGLTDGGVLRLTLPDN
jgi:photosystem II stability/assembly factor-like uncharacterized protein